jgi:transposase
VRLEQHVRTIHVQMPPIQHHRIDKRRAPESPASRALAEALRMVADGTPVEEAARRHGLPATLVSEAMAAAEAHAGRGASYNHLMRQHRRLLPAQELELVERITGYLPEELEMAAPLWDRVSVFEAIERSTGARLPQRTLATYLERWGFAPERPTGGSPRC